MRNNVPILAQTPYNYSFLVSSATEEITIVRALDVSWAKTVGLSARVHRVNIGSASGAKFEFLLYGTNPSATDGTDFLTAVIGTSAAIDDNSSAGDLVTLTTGAVLTDPVQPFLRVILRASGPTGATAVNVYAELSASLVLRAP